MISSALRRGLGLFSLALMILGPIAGLIGLFLAGSPGEAFRNDDPAGSATLIVASLLGGGILRLLVSIDARLESGR